MWLMHWSLFVFFNHENGRNSIIDLFFQVGIGERRERERGSRRRGRRVWSSGG
jgi:hypothetical protein